MDKLEKIGHKADSYTKDILNEYELDWGVVSNAYIAGYEQARAEILRKAFKWLDESTRHLLSEDLRQQFRKAMEKQQ